MENYDFILGCYKQCFFSVLVFYMRIYVYLQARNVSAPAVCMQMLTGKCMKHLVLVAEKQGDRGHSFPYLCDFATGRYVHRHDYLSATGIVHPLF